MNESVHDVPVFESYQKLMGQSVVDRKGMIGYPNRRSIKGSRSMETTEVGEKRERERWGNVKKTKK